MKKQFQSGKVNGMLIAAIAGFTLAAVAAAMAVWAYVSYVEQRTDVEGQIRVATAEARREQAAEDEARFAEQEKNPRQEFVGPSEYGRVSFMYPKTWSVYVANDGSDRRDYLAYLHPSVVPSTGNRESRFAFRLEILNQDFDRVVESYQNAQRRGEVTSTAIDFNGNSGTRFDGEIARDIRGTAVLLRVRDKTVRFSTDAETFRPDFLSVLETVKVVD